jgi:hypothetical protein
MFILYALVIGLLAGLLLGGRFDRLAQLPVRWPWLAVAGLVVQVILFWRGVGNALGVLAPVVYVASTLAVFVFVLRNIRITGFPLIALGAASNLVAIVANGGYMPASPEALRQLAEAGPEGYSNSVELGNPAFWFLTDIFVLPRWLPFANVFSIGDVLIGLGVAIAVAWAMRDPDVGLPRLAGLLRRGNSTE